MVILVVNTTNPLGSKHGEQTFHPDTDELLQTISKENASKTPQDYCRERQLGGPERKHLAELCGGEFSFEIE